MKVDALLALGLVLSLCTAASAATTITVGQGGGFDHSTIQAGIDAATPGDAVIVYPGIYYENVDFRGKSILLRSTDPTDTAIVEATIIDAINAVEPWREVVQFSGTETSGCVLAGFTIRNGRRGGGVGGYSTDATIEHNIITGNGAWVAGGGGIFSCDGLIQYNIISGNQTNRDGGGLSGCGGTIQHNRIIENFSNNSGGGLSYCLGTIRNNVIANNYTDSNGGGLTYCNGTVQGNTISGNVALVGGGLALCEGTIRNNVIVGNRAERFGGGLAYCSYPGGQTTATIENNTICNNSAATGGALYRCKADIVNCILWGNVSTSVNGQLYESTTPTYSCIQDWTGGGEGNIASYPWFADDNYYLLPKSPCVDAGNPAAEYNDACRPPGLGTSRNDMGAYGGPYNCLWPAPPPSLRARHWLLYH